jgi:hypothetical protein
VDELDRRVLARLDTSECDPDRIVEVARDVRRVVDGELRADAFRAGLCSPGSGDR